jgi:polyhydroxyalkanoate synthesis regulator phasin
MYKNFYGEFGSLDAFRAKVYEDPGSSKSFIDGILKVKEDTDKNIEANTTMLVVYGEAIDGQKTQIKTLTDKIEELEKRLAALES